ncbi:hypothetical protein FKM82_000207 [Ascaphus truei]
MMNYGEEQHNELEALESIYVDWFTVFSTSRACFSITVTSEAGDDEEIVETYNTIQYNTDILTLLKQQSEENLGMVMIFVSADQIKTRRDEENVKVEKEAEEAEKQLFETDHNLETSDIQLLKEAGNSVEVDKSFFQDMNDLELDDDDPDYNPFGLESN